MNQSGKIVTRFAPSPNGFLHLGHAYSAIISSDLATRRGGDFLLRIEDIDGPRSQRKYSDSYRRDLEWLGLEWIEVAPQSSRLLSYKDAAHKLLDLGFLYPCSLSRKQVEALPVRTTEDGLTYPGSPKGLTVDLSAPAALRLDMDKALAGFNDLFWRDEHAGSFVADPREFGDVVIVRKDLPASYHLAVTLDDAHDGVTHVTRGSDLFSSTHIHRLLQGMLGLPVPHWCHHNLILDRNGEKLSKSRRSTSLRSLREAGEDGKALANRLRDQIASLGT